MLYRTATRMIDPRLFYQTGVAILTWSVNAPWPMATVLTSNGTFSTLLIGVPERLRELVSLGRYQAWYSGGYVAIWR